MKKQLPKPEHWQDFEDLCKNLWGELWAIPLKIKKNGRPGQAQDGVDIFGVPKGESGFWGIQCKGKDEYTKAQLTQKEIDIEVERARNFKPELTVFIIATTANKDVKIEEYVRILNAQQLQNRQFEILLFSWEDIADEILKHKKVLDFYLNSAKYANEHDFAVSINGSESNEIILEPKYNKGVIRYQVKPPEPHNPRYSNSGNVLNLAEGFGPRPNKVNHACCHLKIVLNNTGNGTIEDWKLVIDMGNHFQYLDIINSGVHKDSYYYLKSAVDIDQNKVTFCDEKPLVQNDTRSFEIWVTPREENYDEEILWQLLARDFNMKGSIKVLINPVYEEKDLTHDVEHPYEVQNPKPYTKPMITYV